MQLNEILEENSVKTISQKTKILEENLESLFSSKFDSLQKTKALGFIAIIEREYHADLSNLREEALEYYSSNRAENTYTTRRFIDEEKKGKSKLLIIVVFGLLVYASWYFLTQFDKKNLSGLIPFIDEETIEKFVNTKEDNSDDTAAELSIVNVTVEDTEEMTVEKQEKEETNSQNVSALVSSLVEESSETEVVNALQTISIIPVNKLWFGLVNVDTKERKHFSIDNAYALDISENGWLVATSSAPFSVVQGDKTEDFSDAKEHYFKIDKNGMITLSKSEYVEQGGWHQW
ncbi:hypothetical protein [Sulfurovum sp.]|uniref:hypothetical protein n=1 Tax=Sulfurovum sp. TaxID=1969726 RepID=UPI002868081C|nr:hypothetical protein [Sulfurovum sp.]